MKMKSNLSIYEFISGCTEINAIDPKKLVRYIETAIPESEHPENSMYAIEIRRIIRLLLNEGVAFTEISFDNETKGSCLCDASGTYDDSYITHKNIVALSQPVYNSYKVAALIYSLSTLCDFKSNFVYKKNEINLDNCFSTLKEIGHSSCDEMVALYKKESFADVIAHAEGCINETINPGMEFLKMDSSSINKIWQLENGMYLPVAGVHNCQCGKNAQVHVNIEIAVLIK